MKCEPAYSGIPREGSLSLVGGRYFEHNNKIIIMIFLQFALSHGARERISIYDLQTQRNTFHRLTPNQLEKLEAAKAA